RHTCSTQRQAGKHRSVITALEGGALRLQHSAEIKGDSSTAATTSLAISTARHTLVCVRNTVPLSFSLSVYLSLALSLSPSLSLSIFLSLSFSPSLPPSLLS